MQIARRGRSQALRPLFSFILWQKIRAMHSRDAKREQQQRRVFTAALAKMKENKESLTFYKQSPVHGHRQIMKFLSSA